MGRYSRVVYGCTCDICGRELHDEGKYLEKEEYVNNGIDRCGWREFKNGKIACNMCCYTMERKYGKIIENI